MKDDDNLDALKPINDTKVSPDVGIGALALNFALKYHGINTVQDGALYQQYKLEGKNMRDLQLADVFETAISMEAHLLATSDRIARLIVEAVGTEVQDEDDPAPPPSPNPSVETRDAD